MQGATQLRMYYYPYVKGAASERVAPMAAGMPRVSNGGKTYTITIKKGFLFSNGAAVNAASFKRAFDRARTRSCSRRRSRSSTTSRASRRAVATRW